LGGVLLAEALGRVVAADVAIRYVVVDAIDDQAARFYQHYGFRETPVEGRLLRKVSDIVADLAVG
jgi:ribosomal protein S18 acetylase RimI-like enzyme